MKNKLKFGLAAALLAFSCGTFADPPSPRPGGASCNPACHTLNCSGNYCTICNDDGCHTYVDKKQQQ